MSPSLPAAVIVLAAGGGTRMKSATPKVLHAVAGRTLLGHSVAAARELQPERLLVVVGHGRERVAGHLAEVEPAARPVVQEQQNGTGHAVRVALAAAGELEGTVVVTMGDSPLMRGETLRALVEAHASAGNAATLLTAVLADPTGYGRVLRDDAGSVTRVVEQKDATEAHRAVNEVNTGFYAFDARLLGEALSKLTTGNAQGEEYLTDVVGILREQGHALGAVPVEDPAETLGVNDRVQLAEAGRLLRDRINERWMRAGVTIVDPTSTWIDATVTLEQDVILLPGTMLEGGTSVASGAVIGPRCRLTDTTVGAGARVDEATADRTEIGAEAQVGPYTHLRPGTRLGRDAKAGSFVEMKAARLADGAKAPHLAYVGDADVGEGSNLGAATVTVNYDGVSKHRTVVGAHARVGSDTMLVAPVTVGDGAYTAAGSVITDDVPPGAMGVARGRQRNVEGWVERRRPGTKAAEAAARARDNEGHSQPGEGSTTG
ncbi:MAG: bifunctional UDP-N-acetylglucosamine diphosphorylase/glucosamine-1-phosphate N-acetyltransferase GlmU [Actinomycetota bacterium]|nr:bifunctional UDP-N-acetylglucosamine diphosphorylase/glucosamine-1-phosphate N-acetyltransferase GlmU [Actinomycetota bacterium]